MRTRALISAFALSCLVGTALSQPVLASQTGSTVQELSRTDFSPAELDTLQTMADEDGISLDEAIARFGWQDEFARAATIIAEEHPGEFSYATAGATDRGPSISFKNQVPDNVHSILDGVRGVQVDVVPSYGLSEAEIDDLVAATHARAATVARRPLTTKFDYESNSTITEVETGSLARQQAQELVANIQAAIASVERAGIKGVVVGVPDLGMSDDAAVYGGARLESSGSSALGCTTAFNVVTSGGTRGILTAGHCEYVPHTVENTSGGSEYATTNQKQHRGEWGDLRWLTSTQTEYDDFYTDWSVRADLAAIASPVKDQRLCKFGQKVGRNCTAYVENLSVCKQETTLGPTYCRLVHMDRDVSEQGDSGGPWFSGGTAYGIHSGALQSRDVFSRVMYVDEALGVFVLNS